MQYSATQRFVWQQCMHFIACALPFCEFCYVNHIWLTFVLETGWSCRNRLSCWDWLRDCHIAALSIDSHATNAAVYIAWFRLIWWIACLCFRGHASCRACSFNALNVERVLWEGVSTWWKSNRTLCTYLVSSHPQMMSKILRNRRLSRNLYYR